MRPDDPHTSERARGLDSKDLPALNYYQHENQGEHEKQERSEVREEEDSSLLLLVLLLLLFLFLLLMILLQLLFTLLSASLSPSRAHLQPRAKDAMAQEAPPRSSANA